MKKTLKITGIVFLCLFMAVMIVYLIISFYYQDKFIYGTYVNGISVKGLDVTAAGRVLAEDYGEYVLTIEENDNASETISGEKINFLVDYTNELSIILNKQNSFLWGYYLFEPLEYQITPDYCYDKGMLSNALEQLNCFQLETANKNARLEIKKEYLSYVLIDETTDILDGKKAEALIDEAICNGKETVSVSECYVPYLPTEDMKEIYELWKKIDKIQQTEVILEDGDLSRTLNAGIVSDWILADTSGMPILDENNQIQLVPQKVQQFTAELSALFDTKGKECFWNKESGGTVLLKYAGSGYLINQQAEETELMEAAINGKKEKRKPVYSQEGNGRGKDEIGNTYIEVDMSAQKLYYFVDGKRKLTTDVVTGNTSHGNGTPAKICSVYAKQKNRVLRGANYASFVYYWMPVSGNIGIHDATWRDEFGGSIYKTAGSHGCINLPKQKAALLYEMVSIGTPVILYY